MAGHLGPGAYGAGKIQRNACRPVPSARRGAPRCRGVDEAALIWRPGRGIAPAMAEALRRFPAPWRADKIPGGYVVRDANGQALAYLYSRDHDAHARQANGTRRAGSRSTSLGRRSCLGKRSATDFDKHASSRQRFARPAISALPISPSKGLGQR
jgi:hypothetical protein